MLRRVALTALLAALVGATPIRAAVITYAGTLNDLGSGRRTAGVSKALDNAAFNAASLTLVQTNGVGATNGPLATTAGVFNDWIPDWVFFQIAGAAAGDTFNIRCAGGSAGAATVGGVAFDSIANDITNLTDSGPGSLRTVLAAMSPGATATFAPDLAGATILLTNGAMTLNTSSTLDASALPRGLTINGNAASSNFQVNRGATVGSGHYQFTDPSATNSPQRFYRVSSGVRLVGSCPQARPAQVVSRAEVGRTISGSPPGSAAGGRPMAGADTAGTGQGW